MKNKAWASVIKSAADPVRAKHFFDLLNAGSAAPLLASADAEHLRVLAALFSAAQALSARLVSKPEWLPLLEPELLQFPRRRQGLRAEVDRLLAPFLEKGDFTTALSKLREFKQMEMLRIAARDLVKLGQTADIIMELSTVADICLDVVWSICLAQMTERHGFPMHADAHGKWRRTASCVLGMGKLGGQELNYSSDVDLLFVYAEEGFASKHPPVGPKPPQGMPNHQFFNKTAEAFISHVTAQAPEGPLYRVDMRLRPEGDAGPLTRSLSSYEDFYAQWGQTWERMMLIKARGLAGDATLAAEFLETVHPFRFPRSMNSGVLREIGVMKDRIENEVVRSGELDRNVKLGRGGIREIEFVVQSQQLIHAGRQPFLQGAQTLPCLDKLVQYELIEPQAARDLHQAYTFLRDVEHRLQMDMDLQTHTIPEDKSTQKRLARLCGFATLKAFDAALHRHRSRVRRIFERTFRGSGGVSAEEGVPEGFEHAEAEWQQRLSEAGFKDPAKAFRTVREFVEGPGYVHVSDRTKALARGLLPRLLALCPRPDNSQAAAPVPNPRPPLSDPDRVLTRLDSFVAAYGARSTLFELWHGNPSIFDLLALLFDRSEFLAELAIRTPDLVDELVSSDRLRIRKTASDTLKDLMHGIDDADQRAWLRRYHQAELMRIGLRDILGMATVEQSLAELSALAQACLQYSVQSVMRREKLSLFPFAIIGMGKLGGAEIDYGSDLDILFVAGPKSRDLRRLAKLALKVLDLVSARTEHGILFQTDSRLRPDGDKGLLVNSLKAYEEYWSTRAMLWEIQSLTRCCFVAGDAEAGAKFEASAAKFTAFNTPQANLACFTPDWKDRIHAMRMRIEKERTPTGQDALAIKTGAGGLVDAEFMAQALCLANGWREPNTMAALSRGNDAGLLPQGRKLMDAYAQLRRIEAVLRRWSYAGEIVLPAEPAPYGRVATRCGYPSPHAFGEAVATCRHTIRESYLGFFAPPSPA